MKKYKILLVDDNSTSLRLLHAVYAHDYDVMQASDGLEALEILFQHKIDLIVTDVLMPNMDGYYLCYKIRINEKLKNIPIIIYTATYTSFSEEQIACEMGANMFIRKPAPMKLLSDTVRDVLINPNKYPHKTPTRQESTEMMHNYSTRLVNKLEQNNIELEEIKKRLEASEARLKEAQNLAQMGSWEIDINTRAEHWSDEQFGILGFNKDETAPSMDLFLSLVHTDDKAFVSNTISSSFNSYKNTSFNFRFIRKDGVLRYGYAESKFEFDKDKKPLRVYGIVHDITEKKESEIKFETSEKRFQTFFENAPEGIIVLDLEQNKYVMFNPGAHRLLKYTDAELSAMTPGDFSPKIQPDGSASKEKMEACIKNTLAGGRPVFEWVFNDATGKSMWCEIRLVALPDIGKPKVLVSFVDITKRKEAEQQIRELNERLEERVSQRTAELVEANKALEGFSYSVSHDLRAPVRAVTGFAHIIKQDYGSTMSPELQELFAHIESNGKRMNLIIDDLLALAKYGKEKLKMAPVNMTRLFQAVWNNIKTTNPHNAILNLPELPVAEADVSMLEQVLVNLLSNAVKYSSKKEQPLVQISCIEDKDCLTYLVKDNGAGFSMENYHRLFGAFQRLHNRSEFDGTGVGLALVKRIIEKHGGTVGAESKPDEGATFWFTLPKVVQSQ